MLVRIEEVFQCFFNLFPDDKGKSRPNLFHKMGEDIHR